MKYTIKNLREEFPTDEVCLRHIFRHKYPDAKGYTRVQFQDRRAYVNSKGHQIYPLAGTIFENSRTPLTTWFEVMFMFASSKHGVSGKEIQARFGMTYKTAWRIGHQVRKLMEQGGDPLSGIVEADETYYGPVGKNADKFSKKDVVFGAVERKGRLKTKILPKRSREHIIPALRNTVARGSHLVTDEAKVYKKLKSVGLTHSSVKHGKHHWKYKEAHTNTIEGFWGQFKRSVRGTHHFVSSKHLSKYLDEFAFRYNYRASSVPIFALLLARASQ